MEQGMFGFIALPLWLILHGLGNEVFIELGVFTLVASDCDVFHWTVHFCRIWLTPPR